LAPPAVSVQTRTMENSRSPRRWNDLSTGQQRAIIAVGAVTTIWQLAMLWDLSHRPAERVRGSKRAWVLASFVRPFGQIAYYAWGVAADGGTAAPEGQARRRAIPSTCTANHLYWAASSSRPPSSSPDSRWWG
jgi:hypothetical protein